MHLLHTLLQTFLLLTVQQVLSETGPFPKATIEIPFHNGTFQMISDYHLIDPVTVRMRAASVFIITILFYTAIFTTNFMKTLSLQESMSGMRPSVKMCLVVVVILNFLLVAAEAANMTKLAAPKKESVKVNAELGRVIEEPWKEEEKKIEKLPWIVAPVEPGIGVGNETLDWENAHGREDLANIQAFDCADGHSKISIVSLEPGRCQDLEEDYNEPREAPVQIIEVLERFDRRGWRCEVRVSNRVIRCWFDHYTNGWQYTDNNVLYPITLETCQEMIRTGKYRHTMVDDDGKESTEVLNIDVGVGKFTMHQYWSFGTYSGGYCYYLRDFTSGGEKFYSRLQQTTLKVIAEPLWGSVSWDTKNIKFQNNLWANFTLNQTIGEHGVLGWEGNAPNDKEKVSSLAVGLGKYYEPTINAGIEMKPLLMYGFNDSYGGLILEKKTKKFDGNYVYPTQVDGVYVAFLDNITKPAFEHTYKAGSYTARVDMKIHFSYLHLAERLHMASTMRLVQKNLCILQRELLRDRIFMMAKNDRTGRMAAKATFGEGVMVTDAGDGFHVTKCTPVKVSFRNIHNCTTEIPVTYKGVNKFVDPISRILVALPSTPLCSPEYPTIWRIGRETYEYFGTVLHPTARALHALLPQLSQSIFYTIDLLGFSNGLYTKEMYMMNQVLDESRTSVEAVESASARRAANAIYGGGGAGGRQFDPSSAFVSTFGVEDLNKIISDLISMGYIAEIFGFFTAGWHTFTGILFLCSITMFGLCHFIKIVKTIIKHGLTKPLLIALFEAILGLINVPAMMVKGFIVKIIYYARQISGNDGFLSEEVMALEREAKTAEAIRRGNCAQQQDDITAGTPSDQDTLLLPGNNLLLRPLPPIPVQTAKSVTAAPLSGQETQVARFDMNIISPV